MCRISVRNGRYGRYLALAEPPATLITCYHRTGVAADASESEPWHYVSSYHGCGQLHLLFAQGPSVPITRLLDQAEHLSAGLASGLNSP